MTLYLCDLYSLIAVPDLDTQVSKVLDIIVDSVNLNGLALPSVQGIRQLTKLVDAAHFDHVPFTNSESCLELNHDQPARSVTDWRAVDDCIARFPGQHRGAARSSARRANDP